VRLPPGVTGDLTPARAEGAAGEPLARLMSPLPGGRAADGWRRLSRTADRSADLAPLVECLPTRLELSRVRSRRPSAARRAAFLASKGQATPPVCADRRTWPPGRTSPVLALRADRPADRRTAGRADGLADDCRARSVTSPSGRISARGSEGRPEAEGTHQRPQGAPSAAKGRCASGRRRELHPTRAQPGTKSATAFRATLRAVSQARVEAERTSALIARPSARPQHASGCARMAVSVSA